MGKANAGSWAERQASERWIERIQHTSLVIENHQRMLRWCVEYARERWKDALSLRDMPDNVFEALNAFEGARLEGLTALWVWSQPEQGFDAEDFEEVVTGAIGAIELEALRRAGQLEVSEGAPLFEPKAPVRIKIVDGSDLAQLVAAVGGAS